MPRDSSLDDFLPDDGGGADDDPDEDSQVEPSEQAEERPGEPPANDEETGPEDQSDGPTPARSTFDWSPGGTTCDRCGETVDRRWREGDDRVCGECKEW